MSQPKSISAVRTLGLSNAAILKSIATSIALNKIPMNGLQIMIQPITAYQMGTIFYVRIMRK
jgi:hypothetical protein